MGKNVINAIVKEREENGPFESLTDFCTRIGTGELNKRALESFIKSGCLDSLGGRRAQYMGSI